jgi:IclR family transcriptional regulator, acetate operon repressor
MKPAYRVTTPDGPNRSAEGRGVLEGAFQLMDALAELSEAGLTAVAAASGLPKATAHRLLEQLGDLGAVERRGSHYRVGHRMFRLGQTWHPYPGLGAAAHHPIKILARSSGASVTLCVLRNGQTVVVCGAAGELSTQISTAVGVTVPWRTAAGKILVAAGHTATMLTVASASWIRERETIREQGVAFDREEIMRGVCCVAVPVRGVDGEPVAALAAVTTPSTLLPRLAQGLRRAGDAITGALRVDLAADVAVR